MQDTGRLLQGLAGILCPGARLGHRKSPKRPEIKEPPALGILQGQGASQEAAPWAGGAGVACGSPACRRTGTSPALSSRKELTAEARELKGELYCLPCHDKMGVPICGACRRPIEGRVVNALGKQWHVEVSMVGLCLPRAQGPSWRWGCPGAQSVPGPADSSTSQLTGSQKGPSGWTLPLCPWGDQPVPRARRPECTAGGRAATPTFPPLLLAFCRIPKSQEHLGASLPRVPCGIMVDKLAVHSPT